MQKLKNSVFYLVLGFICLISLTLLLISSHLLNIKETKVFQNFDKENFSLEFTTSNSIKNNLFVYDNYIISGYAINNIYLNYNGVLVNLEKALEKNYITIDDVLNKLDKTVSSQNMQKYEGINYNVNVIKINDEYNEMTFILN